MATRVRAVRFNDAEDALIVDSSSAAGLTPNAWVRRAVRETAAMETAVAKQDGLSERSSNEDVQASASPGNVPLRSESPAAERVGLEREGWDPPVRKEYPALEGLEAIVRERAERGVSERSFRPDPRPVRKPRR